MTSAAVQRATGMLLAMTLALLSATTTAQHSTTTTSGQTDRDMEIMETKAPQQLPPQLAYVRDPDELDGYQELDTTKQLREPASYLERLLVTDELEKRASMRGFQGMRGKKSVDPSAFLGYSPEQQQQQPYYGYDYDKRAPMGFQGMRGKKSSLDDEDGMYKRAPMGFQGMRGKKSLEEVLEELEKRAMMGFQGMRGKKLEPEWNKRAPMGFLGMRGRKSSYLDELDELDKRALLGFHGMRGKKSGGAPYERSERASDVDGFVEKRPMMMGFHGMRGKRSTDFYGVGMRYEKRSPYRFFGTRGKKNPRWEMRGKFVGVRGKKWNLAPRMPYDELLRH